jgi:hypothetical protein
MDAPTVRRDHHGNRAAISTIQPAQLGLQERFGDGRSGTVAAV